VEVLVTATDPDFLHGTEELEFSLTGHDPDRASLTQENTTTARIVYTPKLNFNGEETFTVRLSDGDITVTEEITFSIEPINDDPVIKHWEVWSEVGDANQDTEEVENMTYSFFIMDRTEKSFVEEGAVRDVDGDTVVFGWIIYKADDPVAWEWDLKDTNGTNRSGYEFKSEGDYVVVLMCNDNNGSFQVIDHRTLSIKKAPPIDQNNDQIHDDDNKVEVPYAILIVSSAFLVVIIVVFVFFTSSAKYKMKEKESRVRAQEERMRIQKVVDKYDSERERIKGDAYEPEIYQGDFEADFFGIKSEEDDGADATDGSFAPEVVEETQTGAAIFETTRLQQQLPPTAPPPGAPLLPPSPPPGAEVPQMGPGGMPAGSDGASPGSTPELIPAVPRGAQMPPGAPPMGPPALPGAAQMPPSPPPGSPGQPPAGNFNPPVPPD